MVRGSGTGHGSRDRSGGYGFPTELDDLMIDQDRIAEIVNNLAKYGGERVGS